MAKQSILYIDGENFLFGASQILMRSREEGADRTSQLVSVNHLVNTVFKKYKVAEKRFYAAKIHVYEEYPELVEKSQSLQESQAQLKKFLEKEGVIFIPSGHVRLQNVTKDDTGKVTNAIFREKGTDVMIAVDMLRDAYEGRLGTALLLSSDSDMHPVISELKRRGIKVVYVGFKHKPNIGISRNADKTILLNKRNVLDAAGAARQPAAG